jgi:peptidoglycan/xylan/chitin deacetylase (PgdA/CDA1 family)
MKQLSGSKTDSSPIIEFIFFAVLQKILEILYLMKDLIFLLGLFFLIQACNSPKGADPGYTEITKWPDNKRAAVSLTYDDGSVNQFRVAKPIMDSLGMPGTFFINTTKVKGSTKGKFIGRPAQVIIKESASVKTNAENFFERASLVRFTGIEKAVEYHTRAGSLFESGKTEEAYNLMDEAYSKVRSQGFKQPDLSAIPDYKKEPISWDDFKTYTAKGHEIACHTVTHAKMAVLDEPNLLYELVQCKADIEKNLGHRSVLLPNALTAQKTKG